MNEGELYYKHSGRYGPVGVVNMLLLGGIAAVLVGAIYGALSFINPFIYLSFLGTIGVGIATGWAVSLGGRLGKVRNMGVACVCGAIVGLMAIYVNWVSWLLAASEGEVLITDPVDLLRALNDITKDGAWSLVGWTPTGIMLWLFWIAEAVVILGVSAFASSVLLGGRCFCERCGLWAPSRTLKPYVFVEDVDDFGERLEKRDWSVLKAFAKGPEGANPHFEFELTACRSCNEFCVLGITLVTETVKSKKETTVERAEVVGNLLVDAGAYQVILDLPDAPAAGAAAADAPSKADAEPDGEASA